MGKLINNGFQAEKDEKKVRVKQKLKIMYILKILMEKTDENHDITLQEIVRDLECYGVTAERKSVYSDIENLRDFGYSISMTQYDRTFHYRLLDRDYELSEMKLLVDAVQCSRFMTIKQSNELIGKLKKQVSQYQAAQLQRQVYVNGRVKSENERSFYSVDSIYEAIEKNCKINFRYYYYNEKKKKVFRHDGKIYKVSPWAMCWDDEKYYLIGYDEDPGEQKIKHFRVDKMEGTAVVLEERVGKAEFAKLDMAKYTGRMFGMFDGLVKRVELLCPNAMAGVIIDRFGTGVTIVSRDEKQFVAVVEVAVSNLFLSWIMALGSVKILGPCEVVEQMKDLLQKQKEMYQE